MKLKTAYTHQFHKPEVPCGCATTKADALFECIGCGAHYTGELVTFNVFVCYDCKGTRYRRTVMPLVA